MLAEVNDTEVYDICDILILLFRATPGPDGIKAYVNACLHRGRALRDGRGRVEELECPFHGFCWSLAGRLKRVSRMGLPAGEAGRLHWRAAQLLHLLAAREALHPRPHERDSACELEGRAGSLLESFHVITAHPQLLAGFGDANLQYDVFGNVSRAVSARGVPSPYLSWDPSEQQRLNSQIDQRLDDPSLLEVAKGSTARKTLAETARRSLHSVIGDDVHELSDADSSTATT